MYCQLSYLFSAWLEVQTCAMGMVTLDHTANIYDTTVRENVLQQSANIICNGESIVKKLAFSW